MNANIKTIKRARKLITTAFSRYGWDFVWIAVMGFLSSFSGALGIGIIIPLFSIITDSDNKDFITESVKKVFSFLHIPFNLESLLLFMAVLFILKAVIQFFAKYINEKAAADYKFIMRKGLFEKTMLSSWPFLIDQKTGYLEKIINRDVDAVSGLIIQISNLIVFVTSFVTYAYVGLRISPQIMFITSLLGIILFAVFYPLSKSLRLFSRKLRDYEKTLAHYINENIMGAKVIKAGATEYVVANAAKKDFLDFKDLELKTAYYRAAVSALFEPISFSFIAVLVLIYHQRPTFDIASFAAIIYLIQKMFSFLQTGQNTVQSIFANIPYIESVMQYRDSVNHNQENDEGIKFNFENNIEFKNVTFKYAEKEILKSLNFKITKGETMGLIGPSGSGKTTLADLMLRLINPDSGDITVDGHNSDDISIRSWRENIGYMPQEIFILNDTVEANIRFYDKNITMPEIIKAAEQANILDFINEQPDKYQTVIGERGLKISGGQRQRVALARILAKKPQILILDEATSSLDSQSELLIQESIKNLHGKVTVIIIAHRISTIMNSDQVLVISDGEIIEKDSPENLMKKEDSYLFKAHNLSN